MVFNYIWMGSDLTFFLDRGTWNLLKDKRVSVVWSQRQNKMTNVVQVFLLTFVLEPHLHLMVEVRAQGPQLPSWQSFSHRWMVSGILMHRV